MADIAETTVSACMGRSGPAKDMETGGDITTDERGSLVVSLEGSWVHSRVWASRSEVTETGATVSVAGKGSGSPEGLNVQEWTTALLGGSFL